MGFCPDCKIEQFGGGRCSRCGRGLVERKTPPEDGGKSSAAGPPPLGSAHSRPLPRHIELLERESRYKVDRKKPGFFFYLGAFVARCVESAVFCTAFHFALALVIFMVSAITELTRTGGEIYESSLIKQVKQGVQIYEYFAFALITFLTFKYRWPKR
ncbi:MAG: hypothetical protein P9M00_07810 [Candidatus Tritonobacter lacicola]|nr:hypothetical protein [Candidatus Tritonobacter lacicola]